MIRNKTIAAAVATNSVAAQTGVSVNEAVAENGILSPGFAQKAVALVQITPGSTPGDYTFTVEEADTVSGNYTAILTLTQATATGLSVHDVLVSKKYVRANVTDATANAGTLHVNLLFAN